MNYSELKKKNNLIFRLITHKRIKEALSLLENLIKECENKELKHQWDNHYQTYSNMLKYTFEYAADPEKERMYKKLQCALFGLNDAVKDDIIAGKNMLTYYRQKKKIEKEARLIKQGFSEVVDGLIFEKEIEDVINATSGIETSAREEDYENKLNSLFSLIWLTDKFKDEETKLVKAIIEKDSFPWNDKCIVVSALSLSLFRYFDERKFHLLIEFYENSEHQVYQRALVGIIIGMLMYNDRLDFYPDIASRIEAIKETQLSEKTIELFFIAYLKAKETEKISKKIQEEILPEMMRMKDGLTDKLDLDKLTSITDFEDKNPDWEMVFEDSPGLLDKMQEMSQIQMEGGDVMHSSFSMLKGFDFFKEISNWFRPFVKEHKSMNDIVLSDVEGFDFNNFVEGLERTNYMCNSDKFSFCLNLSVVPEDKRSMLLRMFNMEVENMNEAAEDDILDHTVRDKTVFTQYLQDIYRFYTIYPFKNEFRNIFKLPVNISSSKTLGVLIKDEKILRNIAEFYFDRSYYKEALEIFKVLTIDEENFELFGKIAYCYQQMGDYTSALENYSKAELFDKNREWIVKKIAHCYNNTGNTEKALEYFHEAEKLEPENLYVQSMLGRIYLSNEKFEAALKHYFKIEYLQPDTIKVLRPIAWCSFALGKLDSAKKYFQKINPKEINKSDYLNLGHVEWCMGNKKEAIKHYLESLNKSENDMKWFVKTFRDDSKHLITNGVDEFDIPLMIDYLRINR